MQMSNNKCNDIIYYNCFYQYPGLLGTFKLLLLASKIDFKITQFYSDNLRIDWVLASDTYAANINQRIFFLQENTSKSTFFLFVDPRDIVNFNLFRNHIKFIRYIPCLIGGKNFFVQSLLSHFKRKYLFTNTRFLVFYEKSFLSMVVREIAPMFEVVQHGNITPTYFPSIADRFFFWNDAYMDKFKCNILGESVVGGYPTFHYPNVSVAHLDFDVIYFSQVGSSVEYRKVLLRIKNWIKELSNLKKVAVVLHPSENVRSWKKNSSKITLFTERFDYRTIRNDTLCCSFYSTVLIELFFLKKRVFRLNLKQLPFADPFPSEIFPIKNYFIDHDVEFLSNNFFVESTTQIKIENLSLDCM